jgi:membrane-associated phospholipid phosphatase
MQSNLLKSILKKLDEFVLDITGLGNPIVLALLGLLVFGWTSNTGILYLAWIGNEVVCSLIKYYAPTRRPIEMRYNNWMEKIEAGSFPSIHSSRWGVFVGYVVASPAVFSSVQAPSVLFIVAILVGITRILLKKHYWYDVLAGWLIGFVFGWMVGKV